MKKLARVLAPLTAVALGAGAAWLTLERVGPTRVEPARLASLERQVAALEARAQVARIAADGQRPSAAITAQRFRIECPPPWRELGPLGRGLWGCQIPDALPDGFHANCNVTSATLAAPLTAGAYYETALRQSPLLRAATLLSSRAVELHGRPGYELSFEHESTGRRLRVLASIVVDQRTVYVTTCSAPPDDFEGLRSRFRAIAASFQLAS